ncbi:hypothetical protein PG994_007738 [Apiospora phragmitis]|uniref:D-arabinitol 2-dehydrogenase n=1 Tax=Apiospora phragmitis TaxID=2905665 RepID=A0ABR1URS1_9PEZI
MASRSVLRASSQALRSVAAVPIRTSTPAYKSVTAAASFHTTRALSDSSNNNNNNKKNPLAAGSFARTDENITVEYPEERTLGSFSLEGKTGVVTGGARGLGLVMGQGMVISGANLAIVDMNSAVADRWHCPYLEEEAERQAALLVEMYRKENPVPPECPSVQGCIDGIIAEHGKIDNLVTSAGFTENYEAINYPIDRMRKLWNVNVDGTYLFAISVAKHLMERKATGSMVFIGSMSGSIVNVPQPQAPYNAAKAAVRHMAASLAVEWAHAGIRVNCISPGYMLTALTEKILDDNPELKRQWTSLIPQGKMGQPVDLMGPVTFLLSDASQYVTGADLRVDGGYTVT